MLRWILLVCIIATIKNAEANPIHLQCNANGTIIKGLKSELPFNVSASEGVAVWNMPIQSEDEITNDECLDKLFDPYEFEFEFHPNDCEPLIKENKTHISKTYRIYRVPSLRFLNGQVTTRSVIGVAWYTCVFEREKTCTSVGLEYTIKVVTIEVPGDPGINDVYNLTMALYTDDNYTEVLSGSPPVVSSPDYVYLGIKLLSGPHTLILKAINCWSTPTANPVHPFAYYLIDNGVVATEQFNWSPVVEVLRNNVDKEVRIKFRVFAWRNFTAERPIQRTYFHCDLAICDTAIDLCNQGNGSQRKRDVNEHQITSLGPVIIHGEDDVHPNQKCKENNGCSQQCSVIEKQEVCLCRKGYSLGEDKKTCNKYSILSYHRSTGLMISGFHLDAAVGIFVLFLVFATIIILARFINGLVGRKKKNENPKA